MNVMAKGVIGLVPLSLQIYWLKNWIL